jgi:hypothetical protein
MKSKVMKWINTMNVDSLQMMRKFSLKTGLSRNNLNLNSPTLTRIEKTISIVVAGPKEKLKEENRQPQKKRRRTHKIP